MDKAIQMYHDKILKMSVNPKIISWVGDAIKRNYYNISGLELSEDNFDPSIVKASIRKFVVDISNIIIKWGLVEFPDKFNELIANYGDDK